MSCTVRPSAFAVFRLMNNFRGLLHRQVGGLLAFEDAIDVSGRALVPVVQVRPVGGEALIRGIISEGVDVRQAVPRRQRNDQVAMSDRRLACCHD